MTRTLNRFSYAILLLLTLLRCSPDKKIPLLELLPARQTGIDFSNTLREDEALNIITFEYFYNGAGVGVGDINKDGLSDIFFAANMSSNRLYLNKGHLQFDDISKSAGLPETGKWATGVSMIDINQDGWLDIYVCYAGPYTDPQKRANELYINNGNNTFTERAAEYGLADTGHSVQAAFFDYDRDGDLDMYLLTNITDETGPNVIRPKRLNGEMINTDRLYRNNGDNTFSNVSKEAGITIEGYGLGVSVCDINQDNWPDVYVSNDYLSNDLLYINNGDGTFTDKAGEYFDHTSYSAMGNDVADYNNDGWLDIISVDMLPPDNKRQKLMFGATNYDRYRSEIKMGYTPQFMRNTLQLGRGKDANGRLLFSEIGQLAGVQATDWSWSALFADIDNDGWRDLLITNGYPRDITNRDFASYKASEFMHEGYHEGVKNKLLTAISTLEGAYLPSFAFQNKGDLTFEDKSQAWGLTQPAYATGAAYADLDNDGDLDYVTNNTNGPSFVFENHGTEQTTNHFLKIRLLGPALNRSGIGTKIHITTPSGNQYFEYSACRGFQSTVESGVHVGLGKDTVVSSIIIQWPDGKKQFLKDIRGNRTLEVNYAEASGSLQQADESILADQPLFSKAANTGIDFKHTETHYADFKIQPLLPHKYSQNGPGLAVADVNNDGLDDFFAGGAYNQSGQLFIQKKDGSFQGRALTTGTKYEEDLGALFFDADQDNDQDLYIVSGGNEFQANAPYYQDRLYFNDGKGNFILKTDALPDEHASGSCVVAADYDRDGDLDLFVGGRMTPQNYPESGTSFIFQNQGGRFTDVTEKVAPSLKHAGMVTSALWTDFNNDNQTDLIVVGEWMPVSLYKNTGSTFENISVSAGLDRSSGWWNSIAGADLDADGDTDYVLGNLGLNTRHKTSAEKPMHAYVDDFNRDGRREALLTQSLQGVNYPAHPRDDLFQQLASFKKFYPSYQAYSAETMDNLLARVPDVKPIILRSDVFESCVLLNEGSKWTLKPLPLGAQFAPVYGILTDDFTGDSYPDILLTGNSDAPDVLTGRYDAFKGLLLKGDGQGNFQPLSIQASGLLAEGDSKGLVQLTSGKKTLILSARNDGYLEAWSHASSGSYIPVQNVDAYAVLTFGNGKNAKQEFYHGSGYLSQSGRKIHVPKDVTAITVYDIKGNGRPVNTP